MYTSGGLWGQRERRGPSRFQEHEGGDGLGHPAPAVPNPGLVQNGRKEERLVPALEGSLGP